MVVQAAPRGGPTTRSTLRQQSFTRRPSLSKATPTSTRLSISSNSAPKTLTPQQTLINQLLNRVSTLEELTSTLVDRIDTLSETVKSLSLTVAEQRIVIETFETRAEASLNGVSVEQEKINNNVVIRGLEIEEDTTESLLIEKFEKICAHIGVSTETELKPLSAHILPSSSNRTRAYRPFIVSLKSREEKQRFLQARRTTRDIRPSQIQHTQTQDRPLIITEHLTKENQKLFFEARSLRGRDKFKFVWTNNGQILARRKKRSSVIRIEDISDVERIKNSLSIPKQDVNRTENRSQPRRHNGTQK